MEDSLHLSTVVYFSLCFLYLCHIFAVHSQELSSLYKEESLQCIAKTRLKYEKKSVTSFSIGI